MVKPHADILLFSQASTIEGEGAFRKGRASLVRWTEIRERNNTIWSAIERLEAAVSGFYFFLIYPLARLRRLGYTTHQFQNLLGW